MSGVITLIIMFFKPKILRDIQWIGFSLLFITLFLILIRILKNKTKFLEREEIFSTLKVLGLKPIKEYLKHEEYKEPHFFR